MFLNFKSKIRKCLLDENNKVTFMTSNPRDQKGNLTKQDRNNML